MASSSPAPTSLRGAPPGPRAGTLESILKAGFDLLFTEGAHSVTASRLHKETGIARTTIYRHWPTQRDIIATLLAKATSQADVADFVGAMRPDLEAAMEQLIFRFNNRPVRALFGALLEFGRSDAEFRDVAGAYVEGLLRSFRRAINEAIERGDLTSTDTGHLVAELTGPLLLRHVLIGESVTRDDGQQMLDEFIARHAKPD